MIRKVSAVILTVFMLVCSSGCCFFEFDAQNIMDGIENTAQRLGKSQITEDTNLIGRRLTGTDGFTGVYKVSCVGANGRDAIFGGGSIEKKTIRLTVKISVVSGNARLRVRNNFDAEVFPLENSEYYEFIFTFDSGGKYIMIDYENFSGSIEMRSDYYDVYSWNNS